MVTNWKISTAFLLTSVFLFRILFVNIGVISSLNTQQNKSFVKNYFSTTLKKRRQIENATTSTNTPYATVEICEEDATEDNVVKSNPFLLIQVIYSFLADKLEGSLKRVTPFLTHLANLSSPRYLRLQVIRI